MTSRIVITKQNIKGRDYLVRALFEDGRLAEASCDCIEGHSMLENIYIGKIKRIAEKINAVFVELAPGQMGYLPFDDAKKPLMARQCRPGKLTEEDEIVVQVVKEAVKTKDPAVSSELALKGNALILTTANSALGISKKLGKEMRQHLRELFLGQDRGEFGLIVRTGAKNYTDENLLEEFFALKAELLRICTQYRHRTCYSMLYHAPSGAVASVRDYLSLAPERIITDDAAVYEELRRAFLGRAAIREEQIVFYEDSMVSLSMLYSLQAKLAEALYERVWLKSGAYLVIEPTEALTVIDVNSGRCTKGKQADFYLKINLEAAEEIARQLRLRNISGICIVDFINMDTDAARTKLVHALKRHLQKDTVHAEFEGITKLGLVEITRKKVKKPLWEQISCAAMKQE